MNSLSNKDLAQIPYLLLPLVMARSAGKMLAIKKERAATQTRGIAGEATLPFLDGSGVNMDLLGPNS